MKWMIVCLLAVFSVASTACEYDLHFGEVPTIDDGYVLVDDDTTLVDDDTDDDTDDEATADDADDADDDIDDEVDDDTGDDDTTLVDDDTSDDDTVFNDDDVDDDVDDDTTPEPCVSVSISPTSPSGDFELGIQKVVGVADVTLPEAIDQVVALKGLWVELEIDPSQDMTGHFENPVFGFDAFHVIAAGVFDPATGIASVRDNSNGVLRLISPAEGGTDSFAMIMDVLDLQPGDRFRVKSATVEAYVQPYDYSNPLNICPAGAGEWMIIPLDDTDDDTTPTDDDADDDTEPCVNVSVSPVAPTGNITLGLEQTVQIIDVSVSEEIYAAYIRGFWFQVEIEPAQDMTGHFARPNLWCHDFLEHGQGEFDPATGMVTLYNPTGMMHDVTYAEGFETFGLWLDVLDLQPGDQFRVNFVDLEAYTWPFDFDQPLNVCPPEAGEWLTVN